MSISRRKFLAHSVAAGAAATVVPLHVLESPKAKAVERDYQKWEDVRAEFELDPALVHASLFFIASHPRPVREAIERHRRRIDRNPLETIEHALFGPPEQNLTVRAATAVGRYLGADPLDIAFTSNTTTGLSLLYHGLPLTKEDEILTTEHDHYSHHESIRLSAERSGASVRRVRLFDSVDQINEKRIVDRIIAGITPKTKVVGVTWVHSSSGLKLPLAAIAQAIGKVNEKRDARKRVLLFVDAVHGLGASDPHLPSTGIDAFASGLHKWMLAPRGTGIVWARPEVWKGMRPLIPTFSSWEMYEAWAERKAPPAAPRGLWFSPGGFESYEHYFAIPEAVMMHEKIGPKRVAARIHDLNMKTNTELRKLERVKVLTPASPELSAGIVCFEVAGVPTTSVLQKMIERKVLASGSPYMPSVPRLSFGIANSEQDVERSLEALKGIIRAS